MTQYVSEFTRPVQLNPQTTALLVIDLQYASASRISGLGNRLTVQGRLAEAAYRFDRIENTIIPNTQRLLSTFRSSGAPVIYITLGSQRPDYSDMAPSLYAFARAVNNTLGNREHEILDEIKPLPGELVINKTTQGAFASTQLDAVLRSMGISDVVCVGVSTNNCVDTTARGASDRGYGAVLVSDATGTCSDEMQTWALKSFERLFGQVMTTDEILAQLSTKTLAAV